MGVLKAESRQCFMESNQVTAYKEVPDNVQLFFIPELIEAAFFFFLYHHSTVAPSQQEIIEEKLHLGNHGSQC